MPMIEAKLIVLRILIGLQNCSAGNDAYPLSKVCATAECQNGNARLVLCTHSMSQSLQPEQQFMSTERHEVGEGSLTKTRL